MEILWWLVAPLSVTALAMVWATWAGRLRTAPPRDDEQTQRRLASAVTKPLPRRAQQRLAQVPERPSGIAVRPSQRRGRSAPDLAAPPSRAPLGRR